ncbi:hypothetical protein F5B20DRAFT_588416 [Whalleya microplaca]|nr:hypothetical protein F5B20DRAFT_588416 [Whalleya microplaca]
MEEFSGELVRRPTESQYRELFGYIEPYMKEEILRVLLLEADLQFGYLTAEITKYGKLRQADTHPAAFTVPCITVKLKDGQEATGGPSERKLPIYQKQLEKVLDECSFKVRLMLEGDVGDCIRKNLAPKQGDVLWPNLFAIKYECQRFKNASMIPHIHLNGPTYLMVPDNRNKPNPNQETESIESEGLWFIYNCDDNEGLRSWYSFAGLPPTGR